MKEKFGKAVARHRKSAYKIPQKQKSQNTRNDSLQEGVEPEIVVASYFAFASRYWNKWTTAEKTLFIISFLLVMGVSAAVIYNYLAPAFSIFNTSLSSVRSSTQVNSDTRNVGFFNQNYKAHIDEMISTTRITFDPKVENWLLTHPDSAFVDNVMKTVQTQIQLIRKLLPKVIQPKLLARVLADPTFEIEITNLGAGKSGQYAGTINKVFIQLEFEPNEKRLLQILRNEIHAALNRNKNIVMLAETNTPIPQDKKGMVISLPFLNENGEIDSVKAAALDDAIRQGDKRVSKFIEAFEHKSSREDYKSYFDVMEYYEPIIHPIPVGTHQLDSYIKSGKIEEANLPGIKYIFKGSNLDLSYDLYIKEVVPGFNPSTLILRGSFAKNQTKRELIKAFISDVILQRRRYDENGFYSSKGLTRDETNSEKLSDLEELHPKIRAEFYKEVCREFTKQYFGDTLDDDYCLDFEANHSKKMSGKSV